MLSRRLLTLTISTTLLFACGDPDEDPQDMSSPAPDMAQDMETPPEDMTSADDDGGEQDAGGEDMSAGDAGDDMPSSGAELGSLVEIDLDRWAGAVEGASGPARVFQATEEDLFGSDVALGQAGDYVLENEHGRYLIEGLDRAMSPCPFGGNVLDAGAARGEGWREDNLGEICLLINVSQTFAPLEMEVLQEGGAEEAAVLAVRGRLAQFDFLNFSSLVYDYLPASIKLPIDLNAVYPVSVTKYYILQPGARALQIVTAFRNDGVQRHDMVAGHLIASGGTGGYFNPLGGYDGFGTKSLGADNLEGYDMPYMIFRGEESSYAYVPEVDERLGGELPLSGVHLYQSGAVATLLGRESLVGTLLIRESQLATLPGALHLAPGEVGEVRHALYLGDGALSSMLDHIYPARALEVGSVGGVVTDTTGAPQEGARVSAVDASGRTLNQAITGAEGTYSMTLPVGDYELLARRPGQPTTAPGAASVVAGDSSQADLTIALPALLEVRVTTPDGQPTPARVTVLCDGECPGAPTSQEQDITTDRLPNGFAAVIPASADGVARAALPAGDYEVVVSRGMEWSTWPTDAVAQGGEPVTLTAGDLLELDAEIAHVVDTPGVISGDFHIHAVTSTDSPIALQARVLDYLTEGVDVLVSTDHDYITDYAPAIAALGLEDHIASVIGEEITTSDAGHINAFPLEVDPTHRRNGALDWGQGEQESMLLEDIFAWADAFPGDQVTQINHPGSTIGSLQVDTLRGLSFADPEVKRLPWREPDPMTGDTRLWAENFTAMEVMNGNSQSKFWAVARWWLTMVGRGFSPTATAVTDTHKLYSDLGGAPRSFVWVGEGYDTPASFDDDVFAQAVNGGKVIGTNGPFFTFELESSSGARAGLGDVLDATADGRVTGRVVIQAPEWIDVDTVEVYTNRADIITAPGQEVRDVLPPDEQIAFTLDPDTDLEVVAQGAHTHRRWVKEVTFELEASRDAYVLVIVRDRDGGGRAMHPVVPAAGGGAFAFANPIYVDADGGGWDDYPLAELASAAMAQPMNLPTSPALAPHVHRGPHAHPHHHHNHTRRVMTREELLHLIERSRCDH